MADLPAPPESYNGGLEYYAKNAFLETTSTDAAAQDKPATVEVLRNAHQIYSQLQSRAGCQPFYLSATETGGSWATGTGYSIPVTRYRFSFADDTTPVHIALPDVNDFWPTTAAALLAKVRVILTAAVNYELGYALSSYTNGDVGAQVPGDVVKIGTISSTLGTYSALKVTATSDNAWGIVLSNRFGGTSVAAGATGIVLNTGLYNFSSPVLAVGPVYTTAAAVLSNTVAGAQRGLVYQTIAGSGATALGLATLKYQF